MRFQVEFYETTDGRIPVEEFLATLEPKARAKFVFALKKLEAGGNSLRAPDSKYLEDDIFELRYQQGSNDYRVLYFFYCRGKIVLTNGFAKKTQRTPKKEIALAKRCRKDYLERMEGTE